MKKEVEGYITRNENGDFVVFEEMPKERIPYDRAITVWSGGKTVNVNKLFQEAAKEKLNDMIAGGYPKKIKVRVEVED